MVRMYEFLEKYRGTLTMKARISLVLLAVTLAALAAFLTCYGSFLGRNLSKNAENQNNSRVAVEKLAAHLTHDEKEQRIITKFLYNLENVFHINPHVLFQKNDYLGVTFYKLGKETTFLSFRFSNFQPRVADNMVYWNGFIMYSVRFFNGNVYYESWYEGPSKYGDWSSGAGFNINIGWHQIVDLNEFEWYQPEKP